MSHRIHVRGARALHRALNPLSLSLALALLAAPAFADEPQPEAASEPAIDETAAAATALGEQADEHGAEVPEAPAATGGVPEDFDPKAEDARPVFLVTDVVVEEGVGISSEAARDALAARFGRLQDKLDVRSLGEVQATLDQQALSQLLGGEAEGLERLASYVEADRVVFGRIHQVGGVTEVSVRVFHVNEGAMELAMSRRLKADAPDSLVLSVVDSLADRLTVWALNTYGDAEPSAKFAELQKKKLKPRDVGGEVESASPWSFMGVGGSALAAAGLGAVAVGATLVATAPEPDVVTPSIVMGAGAATFLGGMALVIIDGLE